MLVCARAADAAPDSMMMAMKRFLGRRLKPLKATVYVVFAVVDLVVGG